MHLVVEGAASRRRATLAVVSLAVLSFLIVAAGCGKAHRAASTAAASNASNASNAPTSKSAAAPQVPPSPSITGDTDGDDEANAHGAGDADNDDSRPSDRDNDSDSSGKSYFDADDASVRRYGHAASARDRDAVTRLIRSFYRVAVAGDGAAGCSLLAAPIASSAVETLAGSSGPPYARGGSCSAVLKTVFVHYHRQLAAHLPTLSVDEVRVEGRRAEVVLGFKGLPGRVIGVVREGGAWKVDALVDLELP